MNWSNKEMIPWIDADTTHTMFYIVYNCYIEYDGKQTIEDIVKQDMTREYIKKNKTKKKPIKSK